MLRDHRRARHAYACVRAVPTEQREDYKVAVNGLGANVMRSGLAATMASLERQRDRRAVMTLMEHLASAAIPSLVNVGADEMPDRVRGLDLDEYMIATREFLRVTLWFKRAVQAVFD